MTKFGVPLLLNWIQKYSELSQLGQTPVIHFSVTFNCVSGWPTTVVLLLLPLSKCVIPGYVLNCTNSSDSLAVGGMKNLTLSPVCLDCMLKSTLVGSGCVSCSCCCLRMVANTRTVLCMPYWLIVDGAQYVIAFVCHCVCRRCRRQSVCSLKRASYSHCRMHSCSPSPSVFKQLVASRPVNLNIVPDSFVVKPW